MKTNKNIDILFAIIVALAIIKVIPVLFGWVFFILLFIINDEQSENKKQLKSK